MARTFDGELVADECRMAHPRVERRGPLVRDAIEKTLSSRNVTYDLHRQIDGGTKLSTSEFTEAVVENVRALG